MLNEDSITNYLKSSRLIMLSKTNKSSVKLKDTWPIAVLSQLIIILEKAFKNKLEHNDSKLCETGDFKQALKRVNQPQTKQIRC